MKKKPIEKALEVLEQHITEIVTVSEWAGKMGYDTTDYFSHKFRNHFGVRPKEVFVERKLHKIKECLHESPHDIYYCIARKMGFADDAALYKFVIWHTGKSISDLKIESEKIFFDFIEAMLRGNPLQNL